MIPRRFLALAAAAVVSLIMTGPAPAEDRALATVAHIKLAGEMDEAPLPADPLCLKVLSTSAGYEGTWEVGVDASEGRVIYAQTPNLAIQYTGLVENLGQWDTLAIRVLVKMLDSVLAVVEGQ